MTPTEANALRRPSMPFNSESEKRRLMQENADLREQLAAAEQERDRLKVELDLWRPLTREEAKAAYDAAEAVPVSQEEIDRIVAFALDPANRCTNDEQAQMVAEIRRLMAERDRLQSDLKAAQQELAERLEDLAASSQIIDGLQRDLKAAAERIAAQSELLASRAEKQP